MLSRLDRYFSPKRGFLGKKRGIWNSEKQPLAATCEWCSHLRPLFTSGRKWPRVAACVEWPQVAASGHHIASRRYRSYLSNPNLKKNTFPAKPFFFQNYPLCHAFLAAMAANGSDWPGVAESPALRIKKLRLIRQNNFKKSGHSPLLLLLHEH